MQRAKESEALKWDSFLEVNVPEKSQTNINKEQLKGDVKDAYGVIFKTEPMEIKKGN